MVLSTSKRILAQEVDQENTLRIKAEQNLRDITKQYEVIKLKSEVSK